MCGRNQYPAIHHKGGNSHFSGAQGPKQPSPRLHVSAGLASMELARLRSALGEGEVTFEGLGMWIDGWIQKI